MVVASPGSWRTRCTRSSRHVVVLLTLEMMACGGSHLPRYSCPSAPPVSSTACPILGLECTWGEDSRFGCRTYSVCLKSQQQDLAWNAQSAGCALPMPSCPPSAPLADSSCVLGDLGLTCVYLDVAYTCANCVGTLCSQGYSWHSSLLEPRCPATVPNYGTPCPSAGLLCDYNFCADDTVVPDNATWAHGTAVICQDGTWQHRVGVACP